MLRLKKVLFIALTVCILLALATTGYVVTAPDIPVNADEIIKKAKSQSTPDFYKGKAAIAKNGPIELWYELNEASGHKKGTILMITGYGCTSIQWPSYFINPFLNAGYDVIRYDHRDVGFSSWIKDWDKSRPYTLEDMADDAIAILDDAAVDKAHVIGISMGGMIAQHIAINHRARVHTMTNMSSTAFFDDSELQGIFPSTLRDIVRYSAKFSIDKSLTSQIKRSLTASNLFKGEYELDNVYTVHKVTHEFEKRNGFNPEAPVRHGAAIKASASRYNALAKLDIPNLVIHGKADPLVTFEHGVKLAEVIPNAHRLYIDELGHDIPSDYNCLMVDAILKLCNANSDVAEDLVGT